MFLWSVVESRPLKKIKHTQLKQINYFFFGMRHQVRSFLTHEKKKEFKFEI